MFGPLGLCTVAPLRYAAKFDPFLSLDCTPTPSTLAQSKERKGSNFAIWQHFYQGFLLPKSFVMSGLLDRVAEFETRPDDLIVAGFPRSGLLDDFSRNLAVNFYGVQIQLISDIVTLTICLLWVL